ncbi:MAG: translocation/assembly module TamB, partial [Rhodonellum sp.]|nr:translocation/assembly module TamB [Rhodonellum sp.]
MEKKSKVTEILLKAFKVLLRLTLLLIFGVVLIAGLLQIPSIQTKVSKLLTDYISDNTGFRTSISKVQIRWWDAVSLKDVTIYDQKDSLMANLEEVFIDFSIAGIFDKNNPSIDQIKLERGSIRLLTHPEESRINISEFLVRINSLFVSGERDPNRKSVKFSIGNIYLENASLDIINYSATPVTEGFDFNQLNFRNLIADADEFETEAGVFFIKLNYLRGEESNSGMFFQQLKTDFTLAPTYMEFANLYLRSNKTEIKDYLKFSYESIASLSNFTQEVEILTH